MWKTPEQGKMAKYESWHQWVLGQTSHYVILSDGELVTFMRPSDTYPYIHTTHMPMQACTCVHTHSQTQFEDGNKDQSQSHRYSSGMERHGVLLLVCSRERRTFFIHGQLQSVRHCHVFGPPSSLLKVWWVVDDGWKGITSWREYSYDSQGSAAFRKTSIEVGFSLVLPPGLWSPLPSCVLSDVSGCHWEQKFTSPFLWKSPSP